MKHDTLIQQIARTISAIENCKKTGNKDWQEKHEVFFDNLMQYLPSGGGFDSGITLDQEKTAQEKIVFNANFHHMNQDGYYDGWTEHQVIITPSLVFGFLVKVTGRNKRDIKDYIADCFYSAPSSEKDWHETINKGVET